eukprot:6480837-Amphidinium_carterae.2
MQSCMLILSTTESPSSGPPGLRNRGLPASCRKGRCVHLMTRVLRWYMLPELAAANTVLKSKEANHLCTGSIGVDLHL